VSSASAMTWPLRRAEEPVVGTIAAVVIVPEGAFKGPACQKHDWIVRPPEARFVQLPKAPVRQEGFQFFPQLVPLVSFRPPRCFIFQPGDLKGEPSMLFRTTRPSLEPGFLRSRVLSRLCQDLFVPQDVQLTSQEILFPFQPLIVRCRLFRLSSSARISPGMRVAIFPRVHRPGSGLLESGPSGSREPWVLRSVHGLSVRLWHRLRRLKFGQKIVLERLRSVVPDDHPA